MAPRREGEPAADESAQQRTRAAAAASGTAEPDHDAAAVAGDTPGDGIVPDEEGPDSGNPKKPLLAAADIAGAILVAVPLLIWATAGSDEKKDKVAVAAKTDTALDDESLEAPSAEYAPDEPSPDPTSAKPSGTPSSSAKAKPGRSESAAPGRRQKTQPAPPAKKAAVKEKKSSPPPTTRSVRTFRLTNDDTGKCLSAGDGEPRSKLVIWDCDGSRKQRWQLANTEPCGTTGCAWTSRTDPRPPRRSSSCGTATVPSGNSSG
ncbi:RICIN domain-containing protein [Streptomyces sp. Rer75]|uniref:RICIN domain-containing protein n=1 Tax=Streptomyces sp. Rer75 TaxID=2750011 RepID=UPI00211EBC36|nr:hypothetical protein [Streptomyces sp. Rer75]